MNLSQEKLSFYKGKSQMIALDNLGIVLESCDAITGVSKGVNMCETIPFLESILPEVNRLEVGKTLDYKRVNIDFFGHVGIYEFQFKKQIIGGKQVVFLLIENQKEAHKYLEEIQQGRNESMIQNEIIEEKNKIIEKKNRELSKTLSKVLKLTISKRALFITMVIVVILVLISEGLIDPIIESYAGGFWWAMLGKLVIALLVKPLDMFLEKILMTIEVRKMNRASIS